MTLLLGVLAIFLVSRRFAFPITALVRRARSLDRQADVSLGHLGITETHQLVDSVEKLSQNVSRETVRIEFFSRMSHTMRTPMNAIISFSSPELLSDADAAEKNDHPEKIHASGEFLLGLINEVLDITRIESGKIDLHPRPAAYLLPLGGSRPPWWKGSHRKSRTGKIPARHEKPYDVYRGHKQKTVRGKDKQ